MKIHFIGIGGIGISALAQYMHFLGHEVSGSDMSDSHIVKKLQAMGITIVTPHSASAISDQDLVIHSAIIKENNVEIVEAKKRNIPILSRREALKDILKTKKVYSVAGAHGKSTTTAMLSAIFEDADVLLGAESKAFGSNVRFKQSDTLVFEADESDASFLNSNPYCSLVINAEKEHMEYYNYDSEKFFGAYKEFINLAPFKVLNAEDQFLATLVDEIEASWLYPSKDITNIEYFLKEDEPYTRFTLKDLGVFEVWGFGEHIALDASLAILAALPSKDVEQIRSLLVNFKGIKKRFDIVGKYNDLVVVDDYGHHPTEIKATLSSAKEYAKLKNLSKIVAIWQPHKYSRTYDNLEAFVACFEGVDELVILPVWAASEEEIAIDFAKEFAKYNPTFATNVLHANQSVTLLDGMQELKTYKDGFIIGFGAGDITYQMREEH